MTGGGGILTGLSYRVLPENMPGKTLSLRIGSEFTKRDALLSYCLTCLTENIYTYMQIKKVCISFAEPEYICIFLFAHMYLLPTKTVRR